MTSTHLETCMNVLKKPTYDLMQPELKPIEKYVELVPIYFNHPCELIK